MWEFIPEEIGWNPILSRESEIRGNICAVKVFFLVKMLL